MEDGLLQKYMPQLVLDPSETVTPLDLNKWAAACAVRDDAYDGELKGSIGQNLGNPSCYLDGAGPVPSIVAGGQSVASVEKQAVDKLPLTGKVDVLMVGGSWYYSLLYMYAFPATDSDKLVVHYVKIVVNAETKAIEYGVYGLAGNALSPAVVSAGRMSFADRTLQRTMVYVSQGSHFPLPRPGKYWKTGPQGETSAGTCGTKWDPAGTEALSNSLMQFKGRLSKVQGTASPSEQPWWQSTALVDTDKVFARYLPAQ